MPASLNDSHSNCASKTNTGSSGSRSTETIQQPTEVSTQPKANYINPAVSVVVSDKQIINQPIRVLPSNSGVEDLRKDLAQPSPGSDGSMKILDGFLGQLGSVGREDLKQNYGQLLAGWEKQA